jgi:hypothetical protein
MDNASNKSLPIDQNSNHQISSTQQPSKRSRKRDSSDVHSQSEGLVTTTELSDNTDNTFSSEEDDNDPNTISGRSTETNHCKSPTNDALLSTEQQQPTITTDTSIDAKRPSVVTFATTTDRPDAGLDRKDSQTVIQLPSHHAMSRKRRRRSRREATNVVVRTVCKKSGLIGPSHMLESNTRRRLPPHPHNKYVYHYLL